MRRLLRRSMKGIARVGAVSFSAGLVSADRSGTGQLGPAALFRMTQPQ